MLVLVGLVTALNLILSLVVGIRLLGRALGGGRAPELSLAVYFVMSAVIGTVPQVIVYAYFGDPTLELPESLSRALLAIAIFGMAVGSGGVYFFTWKTFRPDGRWSRAIVVAGWTTLAVGFVIEAVREGFAPVIFPGVGHWIGWTGRTLALTGVAFESFRYYGLQRRRLRLGLAEPLVANRFLLWGIWATSAAINFIADCVTRAVYAVAAGTTTEVIPEVMAPIANATLVITMVLGLVAAATLFLTFFPTTAYRRWIEARAAASMG